MRTLLNALIIDDSQNDADLFCQTLSCRGYDVLFQAADSPAALCEAMERLEWDFVMFNRAQPSLSAPSALSLVRGFRPDVPIIIVADEIDQNLADALSKTGAVGYIRKSEPARLLPIVRRILRDSRICHEKVIGKISGSGCESPPRTPGNLAAKARCQNS